MAVELCGFPEVAPETVTVVEKSSVLTLGLTPLLKESEGRFGAAPVRFARFGSLSFRPAGVPSEMRFGGGAFETIRCRFDPNSLPHGLRAESLSPGQLAACFDIGVQSIEDAMLRLAHEVASPRADSRALASLVIKTLCIDLARYLSAAEKLATRRSGGLTPRQMRRVLERIDQPGRPPSIDELARLCELSRFHFMRTFRAGTGLSPGVFLQRARMTRAKAMLAQGDHSLAGIAEVLGFSSAAAFSTAFRRVVGRPPGAFRTDLRT
ncbi:helix-turn-helix domain-containing protein [Novosphingobium aquimarinum]|uniref:helix-turn-helix domain-containing protein n=1 Tax=Novosphingobium aquimarinum TaxID=2682494 RepID=UPI0018DCE101|nr:AraC family transcriptional regulator [Novosphingobium aquimarinum]